MRFLHLADLHLGWVPGFLPPELAADFQRRRDGLLDQAAELALAAGSGIEMVVIAGDLFETHRPDAALVERVLRTLARLEAAGVRVVTVPGNHDEITYHDSVYRQRAAHWPGLLVQNPHPAPVGVAELAGGPVHLYSLAYTGGITGRPNAFPAARGEGLHLAVFHGSLDWDTGERSLPLSSAVLAAAGYGYVALGHIHRPETVRVGRGLAVYPGAVAGKGFSDPGTGAFTVADLTESGATLREVAATGLPEFETLTLDAGAFSGAEELLQVLRSKGSTDLCLQVHLTGSLGFELDPDRLAAALAADFYYLEILDDTDSVSPELLRQWAGEVTLRGQFVRRLEAALAGAGSERERQVLQRALRFGLAALKGGEVR